MLPRVGSALAQFIAPITTSAGKQTTSQSQSKRTFQKWKRENSAQDENPSNQQQQNQPQPQGSNVIPLHKPETSLAQATSGTPAGVTQALFQLMTLLKEQRATIMRWLGTSMYESAARQQKKNGRCRKGTIVDERAG